MEPDWLTKILESLKRSDVPLLALYPYLVFQKSCWKTILYLLSPKPKKII